jgi:hypothetical protein
MPIQDQNRRRMLFVPALLCGLSSAFFVFYTARLLYVTRGLQSIRPGGGGAQAGAVVFPLLAFLFGWAAWRLARKFRGPTPGGGT